MINTYSDTHFPSHNQKSGTDTAAVARSLESHGGKDSLNILKTNTEPQVSKMATYLLEAYFAQETQKKQ